MKEPSSRDGEQREAPRPARRGAFTRMFRSEDRILSLMPKHDPFDIAEFELDSSRSAEEIRVQVHVLTYKSHYEGRASDRHFSIRRVVGAGRMKVRGPWIEGEVEPREEGSVIHLAVKVREHRESARWKVAITMVLIVVAIAATVLGALPSWPLLLVGLRLAYVILTSRRWRISPEEEVERIAPILNGDEDVARDLAAPRP